LKFWRINNRKKNSLA